MQSEGDLGGILIALGLIGVPYWALGPNRAQGPNLGPGPYWAQGPIGPRGPKRALGPIRALKWAGLKVTLAAF